jgi:hypothetical protein
MLWWIFKIVEKILITRGVSILGCVWCSAQRYQQGFGGELA